MHVEIPFLKDLVILLAVSLPIVMACSRLKLPTLIGFMVTGFVIGPAGLKIIGDPHAVELLAEVGVVLLLFTVGLEFSLKKLAAMKNLVLVGGGLQVLLTVGVTTFVTRGLGFTWRQGVFIGFLVTLSSTAIVLKTYLDRAESDTPYGRVGIGVLLFQDLCVVPMMLFMPLLAGKEGVTPFGLLKTLGLAAGAVVLIIVTAQRAFPAILARVVALRSREVLVGFAVLACLGTALLTAQAGLSLALGAFVAGIVLSESEFSHQIVADILPFRDIFNGIFFISVGMLLSPAVLTSSLGAVLGLVAVLIVGKALLAFLAVSATGQKTRVAFTGALALAQIGEFSFILLKSGVEEGILDQRVYQIFLAGSIVTMIATPFLMAAAPKLGYALQTALGGGPARESDPVAVPEAAGHVVIAGFGINGKNLARVLKAAGIVYRIIELNARSIREARDRNESVIFGDCTRQEVLHAAGLEHARVLVVAISDAAATRRTAAIARELNPNLHIIVRTRFMSEMDDLHRMGVDQVIPEEFETSLEIFSRVLRRYEVSRHFIRNQVEAVRTERYRLLNDEAASSFQFQDLAAVLEENASACLRVPDGSPAIGQSIGDLDIRKNTGVTVIAVRRGGQPATTPTADFIFEPGDVAVLLGNPEHIENVADHLLGQ